MAYILNALMGHSFLFEKKVTLLLGAIAVFMCYCRFRWEDQFSTLNTVILMYFLYIDILL